MEATIVNVMESWPLQLALQTSSGPQHVALDESAQIARGGVTLSAGDLRPGQRVRITLHADGGRTTATQIEILE